MPLEERIVLDGPGNTLSTALGAGLGPASGTFNYTTHLGDEATNDVDMYSFQATAGSRLTAKTSLPPTGTAVDTVLRLFDANAHELAFNDDFNLNVVDDHYSQFTFTFTVAGTYYVGVSGYPNYNYDPTAGGSGVDGDTGDYRLDLTMVSPANPLVPGIRGTVFNDMNHNGKRDPGEPGLAGITVYLDLNNNGHFDANEPSQVTDANGNYTFTNLQPGSYTVAEVVPAGSVQTFPQSNLVVSPNVNVSQSPGNQQEATIAVNPATPSQIFVASNDDSNFPGLFAAYSTDGGTTWTSRGMADGSDGLPQAYGDPQAAFDQFGNLFLTYTSVNIDNNNNVTFGIIVASSSNGGQSFLSSTTTLASGIDIDQSSVATGPGDSASAGSVWVTYRDTNTIYAAGARVTGLGSVGSFSTPEAAPNSSISGDFGSIAIGPNGQVLVCYQRSFTDGTSTIHASLDADGLGAGGLGARINITNSTVGVLRRIPAQMTTFGIDAEGNLAWDRSGGSHNGRVYLTYADAASVSSDDTNIFLRYSDDNGTTWSAPLRVNDDTGTNSQFLPAIAVDQTTGNVAISWFDARNSSTNAASRVFVSASTDGGVTFQPNVPVSAGISDAATSGETDFGYGGYMTLDFSNGRIQAVWADNSNGTGDNPGGTPGTSPFDIYTAHVDLSASAVAVPQKVFVGALQIVQEINFGNSVSGDPGLPPGTSSDNPSGLGSGDTNVATSTSASRTRTVNGAATVNAIPPGAETPRDTVTLKDSTTTLGTDALSGDRRADRLRALDLDSALVDGVFASQSRRRQSEWLERSWNADAALDSASTGIWSA